MMSISSAVNKDEIQRVCTQESGVGGRVSSVIGFVRAVALNVAVPSGEVYRRGSYYPVRSRPSDEIPFLSWTVSNG